MKTYLKEIIILVIQLALFYLLPLCGGPTDAMGVVLLLLIGTFILSFILGIISKSKIKYLYPIIVSLLFAPSIFIYYNSSATIHILWYFVISSVGLGIGSIIKIFTKKKES